MFSWRREHGEWVHEMGYRWSLDVYEIGHRALNDAWAESHGDAKMQREDHVIGKAVRAISEDAQFLDFLDAMTLARS
jgi:hypothetical protein